MKTKIKVKEIIWNSAVANAFSLEQVVELVNAARNQDVITIEVTGFSSEMLAAQYALQAARDYSSDISSDDICAHLDFLEAAGAKFNYSSALSIAVNSEVDREEE